MNKPFDLRLRNRGMTLKDLSQQSGISTRDLSDIRSGRVRNPRQPTQKAIARVFTSPVGQVFAFLKKNKKTKNVRVRCVVKEQVQTVVKEQVRYVGNSEFERAIILFLNEVLVPAVKQLSNAICKRGTCDSCGEKWEPRVETNKGEVTIGNGYPK